MLTPTRVVATLSSLALALTALLGCNGGGGGGGGGAPAGQPVGTREFRAIAGVSMGGYGAMNLGTKHPDLFGTIGSLGGPVDMEQLLRDIAGDNLEVKAQTGLPREPGSDFTFDHLPPYPDRDTRISFAQDLVISFGNPWLHNPDPSRLYLASDSQPAQLLRDDRFGTFTIPSDARGFLDGGDANQDGVRETTEAPIRPVDVLLLAVGTLPSIAGAEGTDVGGRSLVDLDGDGIYDVGDGLVLNFSEPFADLNHNMIFEPELGESFSDAGLDGVVGTGDFGEGNGVFDVDPDRANWLAEDPTSRVAAQAVSTTASQRFYMDVGTSDELGFARHYANFVSVLESKGLPVVVQDGFSGDCLSVPAPTAPRLLIRYPAGHIGIPGQDTILEDLLQGDFCGPAIIWQRLITWIGYVNQAFPDGFTGTGGPEPRGEVLTQDLPSPALALAGGAAPLRRVVVYRPAAFANTRESFPIVYFLGGYGQSPEDYARVGDLLDLLIGTGEVQAMYFAFLPGAGGRKGSFYVNHVVPEAQVPEIEAPTSGRYEDSIIQDLIPAIENSLLDGRVKRAEGPPAIVRR
jgi:hypothetical protein